MILSHRARGPAIASGPRIGMKDVTIEDGIWLNTSVSTVWGAIHDPAVHARWHPFLTRIQGEHRLGAVRTCDVKVGNKEGHTEERCSRYEAEKTIMWTIEKDSTGFSRMVSGWEAGFTLRTDESKGTVVTARSVFRPRNILVRAMTPFIRKKFHETQRAILTGLKAHLETAS